MLSGPQSFVWQQAANRMHATRGLFAFLMGTTSPSVDAGAEGTGVLA